MAERVHRLASLRALLTREPYTHALRAIRSLPTDGPVIPEPSPDQRELEGLLIEAIGNYHDANPSATLLPSMTIRAIRPRPDSLELQVEGSRVAEVLATRALPQWEDGRSERECGVPGLRVRLIGGARLQFHRLGHSGSVIFSGVTAEQLDNAMTEQRAQGMRFPSSASRLASQELHKPRPDTQDASSALLRRFGLFVAVGAIGIDTWWNRPGRLAFELHADPSAPVHLEKIVRQLGSRELTPRFVPILGTQEPLNERVLLRMEGSQTEVDLRVFEFPRR